MNRIYGNLVLLLTAGIWGFSFVAQSVGMECIGPFTFQCIRNALGVLALLPLFALRSRLPLFSHTGSPRPHSRRYILFAGVLCGVVHCVAAWLQAIGIQYTTVGKSGFLTTIYIILVPILGIAFGQLPSKKVWFCAMLGTVGLYFLSVSESFTLAAADLLLIASAFGYALHIIIVDRFGAGLDSLFLAIIQPLTAFVLSLPPMLLIEHPALADILHAWIPLLYASVLAVAVADTLQIVGQKFAEPTTASLLMSLESVFALLGGFLLLHQIPSPREALGCALVFAAIILIQIPVSRTKQVHLS